MARKSYSAQFKFKVVMQSFQTEKSDAQIARMHDIHPNTLSNWKSHFEENGPEVFGDSDQVKDYEEKIAELEQMLGKKEVELALHKNFLKGRSGSD
jgi:transposase-like protein